MKRAIRTTIDKAGRLVIPRRIRELAAIQPGMELEIRVEAGVVRIEPAPRRVALEERGGLLVAVPDSRDEELSAGTVRRTRNALRDRRDD